jgi:arsenite methyltransferase
MSSRRWCSWSPRRSATGPCSGCWTRRERAASTTSTGYTFLFADPAGFSALTEAHGAAELAQAFSHRLAPFEYASAVGLARLIARQLGRPSRATARLLNLANRRGNERAVELLEVSSDQRALDVGFGGGIALARLAERVASVVGVDPSPAAVRAARERFARAIEQGRVQIEEASVAALPFEDASFDRVLTVHTIYFWPDPERGLREIVRVLRPGGRLVLATDTKGPPSAVARHGFAHYDREQQAGLLRTAGFSAIRFEREGRLLFALAARP